MLIYVQYICVRAVAGLCVLLLEEFFHGMAGCGAQMHAIFGKSAPNGLRACPRTVRRLDA